MFEYAKWIWESNQIEEDTYVEFYAPLEMKGNENTKLRISSNSNYALYINGVFVDGGQYADFPHYKVYDELDVSEHIKAGINHIAILVWYYGMSSFTYYIGNPGVLFEIEADGRRILSSDETIVCRKSQRYISGEKNLINSLLGLSFHVDLKKSDTWMQGQELEGFKPSVVRTHMPSEVLPRETKKLRLESRIPMEIMNQGYFLTPKDESSVGAKLQHAFLSQFKLRFKGEAGEPIPMKREKGEGIYFVVDLQKESSGYLDFELEVPDDCLMEVGWGEHMVDGRCRTSVGKNSFAVTVELKKGFNRYMNPFRRLGCRYIQFFVYTEEIQIHYAGLRPTVYPVNMKQYKSGNLLRDEIYSICQNTLLQCMHEHYEDCPWREQAFYALDARNQMLCGYYAFEEYEFPKANLKLLSQSVREDGLLPLCCPSSTTMTIPSFSLFYVIALAEYYEHTQDKQTVTFCFEAVKRVMETFLMRIDESGLILNFDIEKEYWNFYEWQPYLDGHTYRETVTYDLCLNAIFSLALDSFIEICQVMNIDITRLKHTKSEMNACIVQEFYDSDIRLFRIYKGQTEQVYSVLANALAYLCGAAEVIQSDRMLALIESNGESESEVEVSPASLSMHMFRYEALLKAGMERYREAILNELDEIYFRMIKQGATSFWETEKGQADFGKAASLCHGWSAMPVYYYEKLQ